MKSSSVDHFEIRERLIINALLGEMRKTGISINKMAGSMGITKRTFYNRKAKSGFFIHDLFHIAKECNCTVKITISGPPTCDEY